MKEKDNISTLFERLKDDFDMETPQLGHEDRFLSKLKQQHQKTTDTKKPVTLFTWWKQIAAACILLLGLGIFIGSNFGTVVENQQATFSPEVEKSQLYFASLIETELEKVKAAEDEDTKEIIQDALVQLERLENDYTNLKNQLIERGDDKRILHAMVTNFQLRINLLESVLTQIDEIKLFKNEHTII
ncbi:hypothetical protein H2O64_08650 [Kordia sp. YSTF-M3]|uniref:DUF4179 domain-containing protein n=1 Tax=Kordia aestuariivivens TaxID=2759037 RepID=A0ABR7Q844_9FLAO|nr:hypothetical protein [Kordia aestuariivivens]MBC8754737.1 hypothetical protein [Kordia aestuariivivens]